MAEKSIWMMKDSESWKVTTKTSTRFHVNHIKVEHLKAFVILHSKQQVGLYSIPTEKIILLYLDKEKGIDVEDIVSMTIEKKEEASA